MTFEGDESVFDCPARERHGECAAKLTELDAVPIPPPYLDTLGENAVRYFALEPGAV